MMKTLETVILPLFGFDILNFFPIKLKINQVVQYLCNWEFKRNEKCSEFILGENSCQLFEKYGILKVTYYV